MEQITLDQLKDHLNGVTADKVYWHWTAGHYDSFFDDYHISIDQYGNIYQSGNLSDVHNATYARNTNSIAIAINCGYNATPQDLGNEPPTDAQIEAMAQVSAVIANTLNLPVDIQHFMTHGEAADNADGLDLDYTRFPDGDNGQPDGMYGPQHTCERWDLQFLGTSDSPSYITDYADPKTGGNVLRGKTIYYQNQK